MGVALTSCTVPAAGRPTFDLGADKIEMGVGIHGGAGRRRSLLSADAIASELVDATADDLGLATGDEILFLVNGFGATPLSELYLVYDAARSVLEKRGVIVSRSLVGSYVTSLDMAGCSIKLKKLDDELRALWDAPVDTPALRWN